MKLTTKKIKIILMILIVLILILPFIQDWLLQYPLLDKYLKKINILSTIINWLIIIYLYEEYIRNENKNKKRDDKINSILKNQFEITKQVENELQNVENYNKRYLMVQVKRLLSLTTKLETSLEGLEDIYKIQYKNYIIQANKACNNFLDRLTLDSTDKNKLLKYIYIAGDELILLI